MITKLCSVKEISEKWNVSERLVRRLCEEGRVEHAVYRDGGWWIPDDAEKPDKKKIDNRNKWMLKHSDYVVTYIAHSWGGAAKYAEMAIVQNKVMLNLGN